MQIKTGKINENDITEFQSAWVDVAVWYWVRFLVLLCGCRFESRFRNAVLHSILSALVQP